MYPCILRDLPSNCVNEMKTFFVVNFMNLFVHFMLGLGVLKDGPDSTAGTSAFENKPNAYSIVGRYSLALDNIYALARARTIGF